MDIQCNEKNPRKAYTSTKGYCVPEGRPRNLNSDVYTKNARNEAACFKICDGDIDCFGFHFEWRNKKCWFWQSPNMLKGSGDPTGETCHVKNHKTFLRKINNLSGSNFIFDLNKINDMSEIYKLNCAEFKAIAKGAAMENARLQQSKTGGAYYLTYNDGMKDQLMHYPDTLDRYKLGYDKNMNVHKIDQATLNL